MVEAGNGQRAVDREDRRGGCGLVVVGGVGFPVDLQRCPFGGNAREDAVGVRIGEDLCLQSRVGAGLETFAGRPGRDAGIHAQRQLTLPLDESIETLLALEDQDQVGRLAPAWAPKLPPRS